jgi:hypothetical protein
MSYYDTPNEAHLEHQLDLMTEAFYKKPIEELEAIAQHGLSEEDFDRFDVPEKLVMHIALDVIELKRGGEE